jgi:hypothetical protein
VAAAATREGAKPKGRLAVEEALADGLLKSFGKWARKPSFLEFGDIKIPAHAVL